MERRSTVYVKADEKGRVTAVSSDAFLSDPQGWTPVDAGAGLRYMHAQGNYLPGGLTDEHGRWRYKLQGGRVLARTQGELDEEHKPGAGAMTMQARMERMEALLDRLSTALEPLLGKMV